MSAIVALLHRDGRPAEGHDVDRMTARLAHRGGDGSGTWTNGPVGLGHQARWTTPEARREKFPLTDRTGAVVLTADARLDNRADLLRVLGPAGAPAEPVTDAELILLAWARWGEDAPRHLVGDFAFALWDARRRALFCARDPMGVRPLYYWDSPGTLAVASEVKALFCLDTVPRRLSELRIADHVVPFLQDRSLTYFDGILSLPPGHALLAGDQGLRVGPYWAPDATRELRLPSDDAYAEAFRERFTEAVRVRLRSAGPVGAMLSGGLDSSSVVCTARELLAGEGRLPLPTFSARFPDIPEADEPAFIEAVVAQGGLSPHYLRGDEVDPLGDVDGPWATGDETLRHFGYSMHTALFRQARAEGIEVMLEGLGGDAVVSHGGGRLHELARAGRLLDLGREAVRFSRAYGFPVRTVARALLAPYLPERGRAAWRWLRRRGEPAWSPLQPALARRLDLEARIREAERHQRTRPRGARVQHVEQVASPRSVMVLEKLDAMAANLGLEFRDPFLDRRLIEFCLALPADQKLRQGRGRLVMRHAMAGRLPPLVQTRPGKADLNGGVARLIAERHRQRLDAMLEAAIPVLTPFVDPDALRRLSRRWRVAGAPRDVDLTLRVAMLGAWLSRTAV